MRWLCCALRGGAFFLGGSEGCEDCVMMGCGWCEDVVRGAGYGYGYGYGNG